MGRKNKKLDSGLSLLELIAGTVVTGIVLSVTLHFYSGFQRGQIRSRLKTQASSEIQSFFRNRKKSFAKFDPSGSLNFTPLVLTFPKTSINPTSLARTIINESIEVVCGAPAITNFPSNYNCDPTVYSAVCSAPLVPISVRVSTQGNVGEVYPTPNSSVPMMASLCMINNYVLDGTITMRLTYLIRPEATQSFEMISRTEVIQIPKIAPGGQLRPEILGTTNTN